MDILKAQAHLAKVDPRLKQLIEQFGDCTIKPRPDHYAELVSSIVSQQLSVKAADTIWKRVLDLFDNKMPTPAQLLDMPAERLRACGMSNAKVAYVKDLAEHVLDGRLPLAKIVSQSNDEIIKELTAVKGIGEWTAHMFLIFSLGRLDVVAWGDLGVRSAVRQVYELDELPSPTQVAELAAIHNWQPYASVACWYLWRSLDNKPEPTP